MKLLTLNLENFQGIKSATFQFNGNSASLYGDNATGKTTVFNAITWLLFDKASTSAKNFTPKTKGPKGDLHYLDHAAEASFSMDGGRIVTLRKVFHEVYKKKRGSAVEEFDGHTTDYYIDGVPSNEKEYQATMLAFCGGSTETMKMLTMPDYFPEQLAWDARRKILLEICGDITDQDVIDSTKDLKELPDFLLMPGTTGQQYTVDEYRKIAASKKAEINKQLQEIPGRIDEAQRAIPHTAGLDADTIDKNIVSFQTAKDKLLEEKATASAGGTAGAEVRKAIAETEARLAQAKADHSKKQLEENADANAELLLAKREVSMAAQKVQDIEYQLQMATRKYQETAESRQRLLNSYETENEESWNESQAICPTCHRSLPADQVDKMREEFNLSKSRKLEEINKHGQKCSKAVIEACLKDIDRLKAENEAATAESKAAAERLSELQEGAKEPERFETTPECAEITSKIADLRAKLEDEGKVTVEAIKAIEAKIQSVNDAIQEEQDKRTQLTITENQNRRIGELERQEKRLSEEYEDLEKGLYLCDVFTKTKVSALTDRINGKFKSVRFRLFQDQLNGGVKEDCEVMIPTMDGRMVPYTFANNAARINAGLEIIDVLSKHLGTQMPVFIDNAESVTHLEYMSTQTIRLVVSEPDKKLRMEVDE